ncbi:MAG TPA: sulfotransferase [Sphingomicrobium sp.]
MSCDVSAVINAARRAVQAGKLEIAGDLADQVLAKAPDNLDAIEIQALVALGRHDHWQAEKSLRKAISLAPQRRWPYADLARLLVELGRSADAEAVARSAITADERNPDAHAMLGTILASLELWTDAAAHFESAISIAGRHPQLLTGLGQAQLRQGRPNEACAILQEATVAAPSELEPAAYLAEAHEWLGNFDSAMRELDRAEAIARSQGGDVDLQRSALLSRMGKTEQALALLDSRPDLSGAARLQRGRLFERIGKYAEAWEDWIAGKAQLAERTGRRYAAAEVHNQAKRMEALVADHQSAPQRSDVPQPIFIIGFPRAGTTLTEQIIASHSEIRSGGELPFGAELFELVRSDASPSPRTLRDRYLSRAGEQGLLAPGAAYFTDKMPDNSFWLPLLRIAFPRSPVVLLNRHPLDVLTSVMAHDMTHGFNCGYRLRDAASHFALTDELLARFDCAGVGPTHELRYEQLIADQHGETERLMEAIGLDLEPLQLSFHSRQVVSPTPSYAQVREPLNDRSIGRWSNFSLQLETIIPVVAAAIERGGYSA